MAFDSHFFTHFILGIASLVPVLDFEEKKADIFKKCAA